MKTVLRGWALFCLVLVFVASYGGAQNVPGLNLGGTGTSATQTSGSLAYVSASDSNKLAFLSSTSGYFWRSGGTSAPTALDLFGTANTWSVKQTLSAGADLSGTYTLAGTVTNSANHTYSGVNNFTSGTLRTPNSTTLPGTCTTGDLYVDTDAASGQRFCVCEASNTWRCNAPAGQYLIADDLYNGQIGAVMTMDNSTRYALFGVRYHMSSGSSNTEGLDFPAGRFYGFSFVTTPESAGGSCSYTCTVEGDSGGGYAALSPSLSITISGTSRTSQYDSDSPTITAGTNIRVKCVPTSCSAGDGSAPLAATYFVPS